jgi:hypothetical protein
MLKLPPIQAKALQDGKVEVITSRLGNPTRVRLSQTDAALVAAELLIAASGAQALAKLPFSVPGDPDATYCRRWVPLTRVPVSVGLTRWC